MELYPVADVPDLRGAQVVLPAVAFFNVGELAVDALAATLRARLAARLDDPNLLPVVGNDAYESEGGGNRGVLATALELYAIGPAGSKLFLLQQRAPAIAGRQAAFCRNLARWLADSGAGQVLVLSGLDAQYRREVQLEGPQSRFLPATDFAAAAAAAEGGSGEAEQRAQPGAADAAARRLGGLALSEGDSEIAAAASDLGVPRLEADAVSREIELHPLLPPWPLLSALSERRVPALLLGRFASEGDNVADALQLASLSLRLLAARGALPHGAGGAPGDAGLQQLATPPSWAGLYGRPYAEVV